MEHRRPWGAIDLFMTMLNAIGGAVEPEVDLVESALMSGARPGRATTHSMTRPPGR
jgi:hypothetical protein